MKNDTRSRIFNSCSTVSVRGVVLVCFITNASLAPLTAFADVSLPPPAVHQTTNNGFPSSQALKNQGYDPSTGVLRVSESNRGSSTVVKNGDTITGQQQKTVTATGKYGEKATMSTAVTQKTSVSKLNTAAGAVIVGSALGNAASTSSDYANKTASLLAQGDYLGAAHNAMLTAGAALDGVLGGAISGTINTAKSALDTYNKTKNGPGQMGEELRQSAADFASKQAQAERNGDLGGAIGNAAAAKAAQGAANAAQNATGATTSGRKLADASKNKDGSYSQLYLRRIDIQSSSNINPKPQINGYKYQIDKHNGIYNWSNISVAYWYKGGALPDGYSNVAGYVYEPITSDAELNAALQKVAGQSPQEQKKTVEDMTLNGNDVQKILERMLESQQTNHKELMNQLAKIGNTVEQATTSTETTPAVSYSEPYTPAGSNTPQQTRFEIDKNGNVTSTTIPRPDLKPNGSQAPTRTVVIPNKAETGQQTGQKETGENTTPTTGQTGQQTPTTGQTNQQNQQQQEFCEKNPNTAACAELGESDYEDILIPEQSIDFNLRPIDAFQNNGTCPANKTFDLGMLGNFEVSYEHACYTASLIRPILILITMMGCFSFAYAAVREI